MGLLVGLPLKLFHMLFVIVRLAWPLLLVALLLYIRRRRSGQGAKQSGEAHQKQKEPKNLYLNKAIYTYRLYMDSHSINPYIHCIKYICKYTY